MKKTLLASMMLSTLLLFASCTPGGTSTTTPPSNSSTGSSSTTIPDTSSEGSSSTTTPADSSTIVTPPDSSTGPVIDDSTTTSPISDSTPGADSSTSVHVHNYQEIVDDEYLASEANCTDPATYYKVCLECGDISDETFTYGDPLGHDLITDETEYRDQHCEICGIHRRIYEFEEADSNAWIGGEYSDKLWRIAADQKAGTSGSYYVGRVNDNSVDPDLVGKTYLQFSVLADAEMKATLNLRMALGTDYIFKKAFKLTVNETDIDVGEETITGKSNDWSTWEIMKYTDVDLVPGYNTIRLTIMEGATCDLDYMALDTETPLENHELVLTYDDTHHWHKCKDCDFSLDDKEPHVFDQQVQSDEYKAEELGLYYYSCICGAKGTETFGERHIHALKQQTEGLNDVMVCECGYMERKFDLAASFSNSWSEGTEKNDQLWRQLGGMPGVLDSGNYVSHVADGVDDGQHDDQFWIEIGVEFEGDTDIEVELVLGACLAQVLNYTAINFRVNGVKLEKEGTLSNASGWNTLTENTIETITLKANQVNTIRISPNKGCYMNMVYLKINSDIPTINSTQKLIDAAVA